MKQVIIRVILLAPRRTQTGVVCAGETIDRNDGGNSTCLVKAKTLGRVGIPKER